MVDPIRPVSGADVERLESAALQKLEAPGAGVAGKLVRLIYSGGDKQAAEAAFKRRTVTLTGDCLKMACQSVRKADIKTSLDELEQSLENNLSVVAQKRLADIGPSEARSTAVVKLGVARALVRAWNEAPAMRAKLKTVAEDLAKIEEKS